jgi:hypothetical protein
MREQGEGLGEGDPVNIDDAMAAAQEKLSGDDVSTEPVSEPAPAAETEAPEPEAPKVERVRDESGRFTKAEAKAPAVEKPAAAPKDAAHGAAPPAPPAGEGKPAGVVPPPPAAPAGEPVPSLKAPQSWKPLAREAFAKAPREVQEEAIRIDREVRQVMQDSAEARRTAEAVRGTLAPFEGIARANGMDVMGYAGSVLQTAAQLFQGPMPNRAALIAHLIKQAGVNPEDVNPYLSGEKAPPAPPEQPRFDPREEVRRAIEEERAMAAAREFLANPPEFYETVQADMIELLRIDRARGGQMTPQQAYDRACRFNEDVQSVLSKRKAAEKARTDTAATQAAKAAAVSIKDQPAAPIRGAKRNKMNVDEAMSAAREKLNL